MNLGKMTVEESCNRVVEKTGQTPQEVTENDVINIIGETSKHHMKSDAHSEDYFDDLAQYIIFNAVDGSSTLLGEGTSTNPILSRSDDYIDKKKELAKDITINGSDSVRLTPSSSTRALQVKDQSEASDVMEQLSEDTKKYVWKPGFCLQLGSQGRKAMLQLLRNTYKANKKWKHIFEKKNPPTTISNLPFFKVSMLWELAHDLNVFEEAISIHKCYGKVKGRGRNNISVDVHNIDDGNDAQSNCRAQTSCLSKQRKTRCNEGKKNEHVSSATNNLKSLLDKFDTFSFAEDASKMLNLKMTKNLGSKNISNYGLDPLVNTDEKRPMCDDPGFQPENTGQPDSSTTNDQKSGVLHGLRVNNSEYIVEMKCSLGVDDKVNMRKFVEDPDSKERGVIAKTLFNIGDEVAPALRFSGSPSSFSTDVPSLNDEDLILPHDSVASPPKSHSVKNEGKRPLAFDFSFCALDRLIHLDEKKIGFAKRRRIPGIGLPNRHCVGDDEVGTEARCASDEFGKLALYLSREYKFLNPEKSEKPDSCEESDK